MPTNTPSEMPDPSGERGVEAAVPPPAGPAPARRRWKRRIRLAVFLGLGGFVLTVCLLVILLFTTGWVFDPFLPWVAGRVSPSDHRWRAAVQHARLRAARSEGLVLTLGEAELTRGGGDAAARLGSVEVVVSPKRLWSGHWLPRSVRIRGLSLSLRQDESGRWILLPVDPAAARAGPVTSEYSNPLAGLPEALLPSTGHPLLFKLEDLRLEMPAPVPGGRLVQTIHSLQAEARREGEEVVLTADLHWPAAFRPVDFSGTVVYRLNKQEAEVQWKWTPMEIADALAISGPLPQELSLDGRVGSEGRLRLDLQAGRLLEGDFAIESSAIAIAWPTMLAKPLRMEAWRLAGKVDLATGQARLEPVAWTLGPARLELGAVEISQAGLGTIRTNLRLAPIDLAELAACLSPEWRQRLPVPLNRLEGAGLDELTLEVALTGQPWQPGRPLPIEAAEVALAATVRLGEARLPLSAQGRYEVGTGKFQTALRWEQFKPSQAHIPALAELPLHGLDLPVSGQIEAAGLASLEKLDWKVALQAGPGVIKPPAEAGLAWPHALPIDRFEVTIAGHGLGDRLEISNGFCQSGPAIVRLDSFTAEQTVVKGPDPVRHVRLAGRISLAGFEMTHLWPFLPPGLLDQTPIAEREWLETALQNLDLEAGGEVRLAQGAAPRWTSGTAQMRIVPRLGSTVIPLELSADMAEKSPLQWQVRLEMGAIEPARIEWAALRRLFPPVSGVRTPVGLKIAASGGAGQDPRATVEATVQSGFIGWPDWKGWSMPVQGAHLRLSALPAKRHLLDGEIRLEAGPVKLHASELRLEPTGGDARWAGAGAAQLTVSDFAALSACWPAGVREDLRKMVQNLPWIGGLEEAGAQFKFILKEAGPEWVEWTDLHWLANLGGPRLGMNDVQGRWAGPELEASGNLTMDDWSIARMLAWWPAGVAPEPRRQVESAALEGQLNSLRLAWGARVQPKQSLLDMVRRADLEVSMANLAARPPGGPMTRLQSLRLTAGLRGGTALLENLTIPAVRADLLKIEVSEPLTKDCRGRVEADWQADLARVPELLRELPLEMARLDKFEPARWQGRVRGKTQVDIPWPGFLDMARVQVENEITIEGFRPPASLTGPAEIDGGALTLTANFREARLQTAIDYRPTRLRIAPWCDGPVGIRVSLAGSMEGAAEGELHLDLTGASLAAPMLEIAKPSGQDARLDVRWKTPSTDLRQPLVVEAGIDYNLFLRGSSQCRLEFNPRLEGPYGGLKRAGVKNLAFGQTRFDAAVALGADSSWQASMEGPELNLPEIGGVLSPVWRRTLAASPAEKPAPGEAPPASVAPALPPLRAEVRFDRVVFGPAKILTQFEMTGRMDGGRIRQLEISALEDGHNLLKVHLQPEGPGGQPVTVIVPDVSGLAGLAVAPLWGMTLPDNELGKNLDVVRRTPDGFKGGVLHLDGTLDLDDPERYLVGSLRCEDMTMLKAPCLLRAVAGVSGKPFREGVVFNKFNLGSFALGKKQLTISNFVLDGPVSMNIQTGLYRFTDQFVRVKGDHFLTNFEIEGPIAKPEIWLDNKLIRALGTDDSDWADM